MLTEGAVLASALEIPTCTPNASLGDRDDLMILYYLINVSIMTSCMPYKTDFARYGYSFQSLG